MIDWSSFFYFSVVSAGLVLSVMGLWFAMAMPGIDRWGKRFFRDYFIVLFACCVFCLAELILSFYTVPRAALYTVVMLECLLLSLPLPMMTAYLIHCCGEDMRSSRLLRAALGLCAVYFALLISAMFLDGFSYVEAANQYIRGPLYPILLMPLVALLIINLAATIRRRARLSRKVFHGFLISLVPTTAAFLAHLIVDVFPLLDIAYVISALCMYGFALSDQIEQDLRRQREIARQQKEIAEHQREIANQNASIMVLQMRPHFIYNTMTSIYCLCDQNPQLARQVVMDFTVYLRKNFTAIASAEPIPFASELEHARAYLAVEQAQYKDSLFVHYDTPHIWFRVPPLTLQPIVENAVKHGRDPYAGPFHISIRTRKTDSGSEIVVSDNGRGFHPAHDSEPHTALNNIRQRLEIMCGGSLTIASGDGGGTVVTVTVPFRPAE